MFADDLIGALLCVHREASPDAYELTVLRDEGERWYPVSEHYGLEHGIRVLEGKVVMPCARWPEVGYLSLYGDT